MPRVSQLATAARGPARHARRRAPRRQRRGASAHRSPASRVACVPTGPPGRTPDRAPTETAPRAIFSRQRDTIRSSAGGTSDRQRPADPPSGSRPSSRPPSRGERRTAGEHLVENRAEAEEVGPGVDGFAADLLRRHVAGRADHRPGLGLGRRAAGRCRLVARPRELGDAEVEDLDPPVARDEQVVGLQVAMDDAACRARRRAPPRSGARSRWPCAAAARHRCSRLRSDSPSSSSETM